MTCELPKSKVRSASNGRSRQQAIERAIRLLLLPGNGGPVLRSARAIVREAGECRRGERTRAPALRCKRVLRAMQIAPLLDCVVLGRAIPSYN